MKDHAFSFGLVIAFATPGAVVLWGASLYSTTVADWLGRAEHATEPSIGGFLFFFLASLSIGVFVSGIRWATIDFVLHRFGLSRPAMDFGKLAQPECRVAFELLVENRYRYYQFYSNSLVAFLIAYATWLSKRALWPNERPGLLILAMIVVLVLFLSARDALSGYYEEVAQLIGGGKEIS